MRRSTKYNKGKKPPAFILSLYSILQQSSNHQYVKWTDDQESFVIMNIPKFSQIVLPKYYKHSNYSSFVRQLNMYNFIKQRSDLQGQHIFKNQIFFKNNEANLKNIKRRQVTKNNNILTLANAINNQISVQIDTSKQQKFNWQNQNENNFFRDQNNMEVAAPNQNSEINFFTDYPKFDGLRLSHSVSEYLIETQQINQSIPPIIPLGYEPIEHSSPLKNMIDKIKQNQDQLQTISVGLYKQNKFLINQNRRLQQKLKTEYRKKQQIINQIIKYVINFLNEWNQTSDMSSNDIQSKNSMQEEDQQSSDVILESYDKFQKKKESQNQANLKFTQYAQNQKKILLTLLKQIQKTYSQKHFFNPNIKKSRKNSNNQIKFNLYDDESSQDYNNQSNSFMMSMLLKFIESNNLNSVIERFSMLLNLQRNKKSKNFTIVNCMNDLKQHFYGNTHKKFSSFDYQQDSINLNARKNYLENQQIQEFDDLSMDIELDKQKYLQNEKDTINQMEKQLQLAEFKVDLSKKNKLSFYQFGYQKDENQQIQEEQKNQQQIK